MFTSLSANAPAPADDAVKDVSLASFKVDVLEASKTALVIVDFWATWCGPCKQLTPILEKLARASKGAVKLAKIDVDQNQPIAQQMGVQSVPSVFAFVQGRPVDAFAGALPEAQIKTWIEQIMKTSGIPANDEKLGLETALQQAIDLLTAGDVLTARAIYADILDMEPQNPAAYIGLIKCFLAEQDVSSAREMIANASPEIIKDKSFGPVRTTLELAEQTNATAGKSSVLEQQVAAAPGDHQLRFDLSLAYYAEGKKQEAVDQLLEIVSRDRAWNDSAARTQLVKFFESFGIMDPLTVAARKRLSSILFS